MKLRSCSCAALFLGFTLALLAPVAPAQTAASGAVAGTVTDATGAVVPNVTVTVTSLDTNVGRTTTTGGDGSYKVGLLPPGNYRVKFEAAGFKSVEIPSVTVTVTETGTLNQALTVGAQTQEVTVQSNVETIQTTNAATGTTLTSQTITDIPLSTRNYTNLLSFSAGANASVNNANGLGKGITTVSVNGSSTAQNNFQMDGVTVMTEVSFGTLSENGSYSSIATPNPDAIQEFKIQTSDYDASFGRNPGANVNVVTKSGTNDYHGTAFEFFRNTVLNAADFFVKAGELRNNQPDRPGAFDQNLFGGTIGGPVKKDKLFFFGSYQETRQKNGNVSFGSSSIVEPPLPAGSRGTCPLTATSVDGVGPAGCDATAQAFAAAVGNVVCSNRSTAATAAFGLQQNVANSAVVGVPQGPTGVGAQVACNGANINPVAMRLLQLTEPNLVTSSNPAGYLIPGSPCVSSAGVISNVKPCLTNAGAPNAGYAQNIPFISPAIFKEHQFIGNWDYVINSKNTLSGRYFYSTDPTLAPIGLGSTSTTPGTGLPGAPLLTTFTYDTAVLRLTTIVTSNLVNEAHVTYEFAKANDKPQDPFTNNQVGILPVVAAINQLDDVSVTGNFSVGTQNIQFQTVEPSQYIAGDQVSWSHGKQTIRFGFEGERDDTNWVFPGLQVAGETFPRFADFLLGLPGCASPGAPCTATQNTGTNASGTTGLNISSLSSSGAAANSAPPGLYHEYRVTALDGFIQDDIKLSSRFTLNAGLRWDYDGETTDGLGRLTNLSPSIASLVTAATVGTTPCTGTLVGFTVPANYNVNRNGPLIQSYPANYSPNGTTFPCGAGNPASVVTGVTKLPRNSTFGLQSSPLDDFAPRLGFAWQPFHNNRFVVRSGAGFFFDRLPLGSLLMGVEQGPPYSNTLTQSGTNNFFATEAVPFAPVPLGWTPRYVNPVANAGLAPVGQLPSSSIANPILPDSFKVPVVYEWNLTVQYEFKPSWVLELGYVGSEGVHQFIAHSINTPQLANAAGLNCGFAPGTNVYPNFINSSGCVTTVSASNPILRVPLLGVATNQSEDDTNGNIKYNSAQVTVRKQMSHGLTMQAAYTWSRAFITTYGSLNTANPYANIYGLNPAYHPNRFVINYSWAIPSGNHQGVVGKLVNGWALAGVTTIQNGTPLTITDSGGTGFGVTSGRVQYCSGMGISNLLSSGSIINRLGSPNSTTGYFVTTGPRAASITCPAPTLASLGFANTDPGNGSTDPAPTGFGNSGIGSFLGPGQFNFDMSLIKDTVVGGLHEGAVLEFRAEFFNLFNHPQFSNPSTSLTNGSSATFGSITSTTVNPRLMQLALKYIF